MALECALDRSRDCTAHELFVMLETRRIQWSYRLGRPMLGTVQHRRVCWTHVGGISSSSMCYAVPMQCLDESFVLRVSTSA